MVTATAPGCAIPAGGKDCVQVFSDFNAISVAVIVAALEPFTQRVLELAISTAKRANAAVTTDMGVSE